MGFRRFRLNRAIFRTAALLALFLPFAVLCPADSAADIYRYIDSRGVLHFTNVPTDPAFRLYMKERGRPKKTMPLSLPTRYDAMISEAARQHRLSPELLKALIKVESDFNPQAVSRAGALGLMQIMPENLSALRVQDPFDPWENIMGGSRYLNQMLQRFEGKLHLALAAYNAGPTIVERYNRIPPIRETQEYVEKVLKYYHAFRQ